MKKALLIILSIGMYGFLYFIQLFIFIGINLLVFNRGVGAITSTSFPCFFNRSKEIQKYLGRV
jgi:hypothetical protein